jgi:hypothetical protein
VKTWDKILEELGIIEESFKNKARLILNQQQRVAASYLPLTLKILKELDLSEFQVQIGGSRIEPLTFKIEIPWEDATLDDQSYYEALVSDYLLNYIRQNLASDTETLEVYSMVDKIEVQGRELSFTSFIRMLPFQFNSEDPQIKAVEDYLVIRENYPLNAYEIEQLSRKQKKYLVYKAQNRKNLT